MEEYKNETVRYINGYKVTSRVVQLSKEEEDKRYSDIRMALKEIAANKKKNVTA